MVDYDPDMEIVWNWLPEPNDPDVFPEDDLKKFHDWADMRPMKSAFIARARLHDLHVENERHKAALKGLVEGHALMIKQKENEITLLRADLIKAEEKIELFVKNQPVKFCENDSPFMTCDNPERCNDACADAAMHSETSITNKPEPGCCNRTVVVHCEGCSLIPVDGCGCLRCKSASKKEG